MISKVKVINAQNPLFPNYCKAFFHIMICFYLTCMAKMLLNDVLLYISS